MRAADPVTSQAWLSLSVVLGVVGLLGFSKLSADLVFMGGLTLLLVAGVVTPGEALAGFSNQGMITVAALYVVVVGLRETGGIAWLAQYLLGRPRSLLGAQLRVMLPVTVMSAFVNNTPVVAMLIPAVSDLAKRHNFAPSKLMIPLSYAAIFGGTTTLVGTSTNLVVNGLIVEQLGLPSLGMFDLTLVGLPVALVGLVAIALLGRRLLPDRQPARSLFENPREYTVEMLVPEGSPLIGKTVEGAGLRHLPELYLVEIDRNGQIIPAVSPSENLLAGDRLVFAGVIESVLELQKLRGLQVATEQIFKLDAPRSERVLTEAVVSDSCPLVGKTIRDGRFRSLYNAVVIAVARGGARLNKKIGDIVLSPGDTLLLETLPNFALQQRNSRDFFLVSSVADSAPLRHERAFVALGLLLALVVAVTAGADILYAALVAAVLTVATGCCNATEARRGVDWNVLVVIAASFGLGRALEVTGAASVVATGLANLAGPQPWLNLALVYLVTALFTALITNNAAAVLMFPIVLGLAQNLEVSVMPFIITIMMAASASFATPIGYQTNLMVYGPGGYHFSDYLRIGLPLTLLLGLTALVIIPFVWRF